MSNKKNKIKYHLENKLLESPLSLIKIIAIVTIAVVFIVSLLIIIFNISSGDSFIEIFWDNLAYSINAWLPFASDVDSNTGKIILISVCSICGLFVTSLLISIISSFLEKKIDDLKKGTSQVVENDHIILLGFVFGEYTLLKEVIKNVDGKNQTILIACEQEVEEVIESIYDNVVIPNNIHIVCRKIDYKDIESFKRCSINTAKTVIMSPLDDKKIALNLFIISKIVKNDNKNITIVAAVKNDKYLIPSSALSNKDTFILILSNFISRIISQTAIQPGLSLLYIDIFNYKGSEFYVLDNCDIAGQTFGNLYMNMDGGVPIGIISNGNTILNPEVNHVLKNDDKLIVFSNDVNSSHLANTINTYDLTQRKISNKKSVKNVLVLGQNKTINELFDYLLAHKQNVFYCSGSLDNNNHFSSKIKDYSSTYSLDSIKDLQELVKDMDRVVILSNRRLNREEADIDSMLLIAKLREIRKQLNFTFTMVTEMKSPANRSLIHKADYTDYIVRTNIISMFLAQLSLKPILYQTFKEILSPEGNELSLIASTNIVKTGSYTTIQLREYCRQKGYIFLGIIRKNGKDYLTHFNPPLNESIDIKEEDDIAVLGKPF